MDLSSKKPLIGFLATLFFVSVPFQVGPHFWQNNLNPYGMRLDYLSVYIYPVDIFAIMLSFYCIFHYKNLISRSSLFKIMLILFCWNLIQLFWVEQWMAHLAWSLRILAGYLSGLTLYLNFHLISRFFFKSIILLLLIIAIMSVGQMQNRGSLGGFWYFLGERHFNLQTPGIARSDIGGVLVMRPYASFSHPNVMAGFILVILWLGMRAVGKEINNFKKIWLIIISAFLIFISASQIAWLGLLILLISELIMPRLSSKARVCVLVFMTLLTIFGPLFLLSLSDFRQDISMRNEILLGTNLDYLDILLGTGWFGSLLTKSVGDYYLLQPTHNALWELGMSLGLLTTLIFCILLCKQVKIYLNHENTQLIILILWLTAFDHYLLSQTQTFYVTLIALSYALYNQNLLCDISCKNKYMDIKKT